MLDVLALTLGTIFALQEPAAPAPDDAQPEVVWGPWHVLGPFDSFDGWRHVDRALPPEEELEEMLPGEDGPDLEQTYRGKQRAKVGWNVPDVPGERAALDVGVLDFTRLLPNPDGAPGWTDNAFVYLYRAIDAPTAGPLPLDLGSDDSLRVWLNGRLVLHDDVGRVLDVRDSSAVLDLAAGRNHLFVKVGQGGGGWGFRMAPPRERMARSSLDAAIDAAIENGVDWLLARQLPDGSWEKYPEFGCGHTALTTYALLKSGVPPDHPAMLQALAYLRAHPPEHTYAAACVLLAVASTNEHEHRPWLESLRDQLVATQDRSGLWSYPRHPHGATEPDLSNAVFAVMALRAAAEAGLEVPQRTWERTVQGVLTTQARAQKVLFANGDEAEEAGFTYRPREGEATASMTTAGVAVLAIARQQLDARLPKAKRDRAIEAEQLGVHWLARRFTTTYNPGAGTAWQYFSLYGIERVGSLLDLETIGGHEWYAEGAEYLVERQGTDGGWAGPTLAEVDTPLALLFLKRATRPTTGRKQLDARSWATSEVDAALRLRASGDAPIAVWIEALGERARAHEWPGEEGRGPRVVRVEYVAERADADGAAPEAIGLAEGDPEQPCGAERFAVQHRFATNGDWLVRARMTLVPAPGADALVLESPPLAVVARRVVEPWKSDYPTDGRRNLLRDVRSEVQASSHADANVPAHVADGLLGTYWLCRKDDRLPWLRLRLRRAERVSRIVITHAFPRPLEADGARVDEIELVLDGERALRLKLEPRKDRKSVVALPEPVKIEELEVRILSAARGELGSVAVGLAEIELQLADEHR